MLAQLVLGLVPLVEAVLVAVEAVLEAFEAVLEAFPEAVPEVVLEQEGEQLVELEVAAVVAVVGVRPLKQDLRF